MFEKEDVSEWFLSYGNHIYNFLVYYTGRRDVEDLVQEVFYRAIKHLHDFEGRSEPKTWLMTIARRVAIDKARRDKIIQFIAFDFTRDKRTDQTPEKLFLVHEELHEMYNEIKKLKKSYQDVIILRLILDYSVEETAEILGWNKEKVSFTLSRALKKLKKEWKEDPIYG